MKLTLPVWSMLTQMLGGLSPVLYGMDQMTQAVKFVAGNRMRDMHAG